MNLKNWYLTEFPDDVLGSEIYDNLTVEDVIQALLTGDDIYDTIGSVDSLVRERIFEKVASETEQTYNDIYECWCFDKSDEITVWFNKKYCPMPKHNVWDMVSKWDLKVVVQKSNGYSHDWEESEELMPKHLSEPNIYLTTKPVGRIMGSSVVSFT